MHTLISLIFLYKLCFVATLKYSKPFLLENYVCIVALALNLQRVPLYGTIEFLHYSSTTELLSLLILIKGCYPSFKAYYYARKSLLAL